MGIPGLTSFIRNRSEFFQDVFLCNCKLLIDGNSLYYTLYFSSGIDIVHGGDYARFADIVREFFTALQACHVSPFVVFDGMCDKDNKKLATLKRRKCQRILEAHSLSGGGHGYILPILAGEVFIQTTMSLRVPMAWAEVEADPELAALAKQWNCPVLSQDSDFFIFNIPGGVCAFDDLPWHTLCVKPSSGQRYICHLHRKFFLKTPRLLSILAVLLGNDYLDPEFLQPFMSAITQTVKRGPVTRHLQIEILIRWLSTFNDERDALSAAMQYIMVSKRGVQEQKLLDIAQVCSTQLRDIIDVKLSLVFMQVDSRYNLFLTLMGCFAEDLADLPMDLQLAAAATKHWLNHAVAPKPRPWHLHALLLGFVYGNLTASISAGKPPDTGRNLKNCIVKALMKLSNENVMRRPEEVTSHVCNQWFSCLLMAIHLNKILGYPLQDPPLER
uniref:Asteroid domain-containing protein n=1 Tax=Eptatretus burgeri TaxID=7764 RepID=A0A8C4QXN9_EPTBU